MQKERSAAVQVANALKIPTQTLYSRFYAHGLKLKGQTVAQILKQCERIGVAGTDAARLRLGPLHTAPSDTLPKPGRKRGGNGSNGSNGHAATAPATSVDWSGRVRRALQLLTPLDMEARDRIASHEELPSDWRLCEAYSILTTGHAPKSKTDDSDELAD